MQEPPSYGQSSSLSFVQGFISGQVFVTILLGLFIKFFIFGEGPPSEPFSKSSGRRSHSFSSGHSSGSAADLNAKKRPSALRTTAPLTTASILAKTYYNVNGHQPESVDWFNVLIAQTIAQLRNDAQQDNAILTTLTNLLNGSRKPEYLDEIRVTEVNLGEEFPIFSNCRVIPMEGSPAMNDGNVTASRPSSSGGRAGDSGKLQARMDVDLSDCITLGIETKLLLNYPKPFVAVMPIALAVSVVRFSGTLSVSFTPSPSPETPIVPTPTPSGPDSSNSDNQRTNTTTPTTLTFSFLPDYRLELSTHSLLGSRSRLQDIPKIAQLIEARLHSWFDERCVEPRFQQVVLPSLWPRRSNTRGGEAEESLDTDAARHKHQRERSASIAVAQHSIGDDSVDGIFPSEKPGANRVRLRRNVTQISEQASRESSGTREGDGFKMPGPMPGALP